MKSYEETLKAACGLMESSHAPRVELRKMALEQLQLTKPKLSEAERIHIVGELIRHIPSSESEFMENTWPFFLGSFLKLWGAKPEEVRRFFFDKVSQEDYKQLPWFLRMQNKMDYLLVLGGMGIENPESYLTVLQAESEQTQK